PPAELERVPVIRVPRAGGRAVWLADDFDRWLACFFHDAAKSAPDVVAMTLFELDLPDDFARPLARTAPPAWFFEAHHAVFSIAEADAALDCGDLAGAERMPVSAALNGAVDQVRLRLPAVYDRLGWDHQRAAVCETW